MKFISAVAALIVAVSAKEHFIRPIEDTFVWVNSQAQDGGNTRVVEVKRVDKQNSPGKFNKHNWESIQGCLEQNSNEEKWSEDAHPAYKTDLQMLQTGVKKADPCD